mmetsp:Transcript_32009/g.68184  ORF Transcript_32009/g.68184 Transcript_32009/m.68184 type:complete len:107 (+) Transcript_32009:459-779(+)
MYLNTVSEMGGEDFVVSDSVDFAAFRLLMLPLLFGVGILATTAHVSKIKGATTKKATATLKSSHTRDRTHISLSGCRGWAGPPGGGRVSMVGNEKDGLGHEEEDGL